MQFDELQHNCNHVLQLVVLAAYCKELELQSHLIHLNYTGKDFLALHAYLKTQYQKHQEEFDALAEFVLTAGHFMPATACQLRSVLPHFEEIDTTKPDCIVSVYIDNLNTQAEMARNLAASAAAARAIDVEHYAAELVASAAKAVWFLTASSGPSS